MSYDAGVTPRFQRKPSIYFSFRKRIQKEVDEVVFAQRGDMKLLGSRTPEGFGATVDTRKKRLVASGPQLAAQAALTPIVKDK